MDEKYVLYGNGTIGKKYIETAELSKIVYILDKKIERKSENQYEGIKVKNPDDYFEKYSDDYYILIAVWNWQPIAEYLESFGLVIGKHYSIIGQNDNRYINYSFFCRLVDKNPNYVKEYTDRKSVAMCYGMCHMKFYMNELSNQKSFSDTYVFVELPMANDINATDYCRLNDNRILKWCDLLIYNNIDNSLNAGVVKSETILSQLQSKTKTLCVTGAHFKGFFPQMISWNRSNANEKLVSFFAWGDKFINRMCKQGLSTEEMYSTLQNGEFLNRDVVIDYFEEALNYLKLHEKECDVTIADYIEHYYKTRLLYYSPTHLTEQTMYEIVRRIMGKLEIVWNDLDCRGCLPTDTHEMPVYSSVIEALEIDEKLFCGRHFNPGDYYNNKEKLSLKEYVDEYSKSYKCYGMSSAL